ncbi:hypothetical protein GCM10020367_71010 [Streptomyces sannanensis]|uniref:Uncharacterized protein n=1 Tax=Streptomyces sannanensis TaxID=285536 RepID=A0ABP6SNU9_9ACTN
MLNARWGPAPASPVGQRRGHLAHRRQVRLGRSGGRELYPQPLGFVRGGQRLPAYSEYVKDAPDTGTIGDGSLIGVGRTARGAAQQIRDVLLTVAERKIGAPRAYQPV